MALEDLMAPDWAGALSGIEDELRSVLAFVAAEAGRGTHVLPAASNILRAFRQPLADVKVLILGQDPYPTPGHAVGLSFAVSGQTRPIPAASRTSTGRWKPISGSRRGSTAIFRPGRAKEFSS